LSEKLKARDVVEIKSVLEANEFNKVRGNGMPIPSTIFLEYELNLFTNHNIWLLSVFKLDVTWEDLNT